MSSLQSHLMINGTTEEIPSDLTNYSSDSQATTVTTTMNGINETIGSYVSHAWTTVSDGLSASDPFHDSATENNTIPQGGLTKFEKYCIVTGWFGGLTLIVLLIYVCLLYNACIKSIVNDVITCEPSLRRAPMKREEESTASTHTFITYWKKSHS